MLTAVAELVVTVIDEDGELSLEMEEGPEAGQLKAGAETWARLFTADPDGDSQLLNILRYVSNERPEMAAELVDGARAFARQLAELGKEEFEPEPEEEDDAEAEAVRARYRKLLSSQLPACLWHKASADERERLVEDAVECCERLGLNFQAYRTSLTGTNHRDDLGTPWRTVSQYLRAV